MPLLLSRVAVPDPPRSVAEGVLGVGDAEHDDAHHERSRPAMKRRAAVDEKEGKRRRRRREEPFPNKLVNVEI